MRERSHGFSADSDMTRSGLFKDLMGCYEENGLERREFLGRPVGGCYSGSGGRRGEGEVSSYGKKYTDSGESSGGKVDGSRGCTVFPSPPFMV